MGRAVPACGIRKSSNVSLKCPKIPATAMAMPAKYVYVSPTNTCRTGMTRSQQATLHSKFS